MNYYGQISLTKLGEWVRKHPEAVKEVAFADGHKEQMVSVDVRDRQQPGKFGDVAYIRLYHKESGDKEYIADLKVSKYGEQAQTAAMPQPTASAAVKATEYMAAATQSAPAPAPAPNEPVYNDLPF